MPKNAINFAEYLQSLDTIYARTVFFFSRSGAKFIILNFWNHTHYNSRPLYDAFDAEVDGADVAYLAKNIFEPDFQAQIHLLQLTKILQLQQG